MKFGTPVIIRAMLYAQWAYLKRRKRKVADEDLMAVATTRRDRQTHEFKFWGGPSTGWDVGGVIFITVISTTLSHYCASVLGK